MTPCSLYCPNSHISTSSIGRTAATAIRAGSPGEHAESAPEPHRFPSDVMSIILQLSLVNASSPYLRPSRWRWWAPDCRRLSSPGWGGTVGFGRAGSGSVEEDCTFDQDRLSKNLRNHAETSRFSTPVESSHVQSGSLCTWESVTGKPTIRGNPVITRRTRNRPVRGSLSHVQHPASRPDRGRLRPESARPGERCIRHPFARHRRSDFNTFCPARPAPTACASGAGDG